MYTNQSLLNSSVSDTEPAANRIFILNLNGGGIAVGQFWGGFDPCGGKDADETAPNVIDYLNNSSPYPTLPATQTGLTIANGFVANYAFNVTRTRIGWIKLFRNGQKTEVRVKQHAGWISNSQSNIPMERYPNYFLEILEIGSGVVLADYVFFDSTFMIDRDNEVVAQIESANYQEIDRVGISIGTNGTAISASYTIGYNDNQEISGESMSLTVTVRKNDANGALISTTTDSSSYAVDPNLQVNELVTAGDIGTASRIWIKVELSLLNPI